MTRALAIAVLLLGCKDKQPGPGEQPKPPPPCESSADCVLRVSNPCERCSSCKAFHTSEPTETCKGKQSDVKCDAPPCDGYTAECIKGSCAAVPKSN